MDIRTLVATFTDYSTARQAGRELENLGIAPGAIQLQSNQKTAGAGSTTATEEEHPSGFASWWNSLFGSEDHQDERRTYEGTLTKGGTILSATVPEASVESATEILNRYGAVEVERQSSEPIQQTTSPTANAGPIPVVEEELQVGKRSLQRGGVRVYSRMVSEPVEEKIRLSEEHVRVERRPVNRDLTTAEVSALKDQTIEVTEMAEEPVISKRARVREEVVVGKESTERTETVRDTLRHTEVEVEQLGGTQTGTQYASGSGSDLDQLYAPGGANFDTMRPAYDYGYQSASDTRYHGKSWDQVETNLRSDYETRNPGGSWERVKESVRHGWDKVTGK